MSSTSSPFTDFDDFAAFHAGIGQRTAGIDILHQHATRLGQPQAAGNIAGDALAGGPDPGQLHPLAAFDAFDHAAGEIGGNGEADADIAAAARIDGSVDAGQLAVGGDQGAAGIAWINRGIGLDEELIIAGRDLGAGKCGDDAHGDGLADPEGIADRQHQVTDLDLVAVGERTTGKRSPLVSILSTARSVRGSACSTLALNSRLSDSATVISLPPSTT